MTYYNRFDPSKLWDAVMFLQGPILQAPELNEAQSILFDIVKGIADSVYQDGHVVSGAAASIVSSSLTVGEGQVYIYGKVRTVPSRTFTVPTTGAVSVGVWLADSTVTSVEDVTLLNPPNNLTPGANRLKRQATWGISTDVNTGNFFAVYTVIDGVLQPLLPRCTFANASGGAFSSSPTAPSPGSNDNSLKLATTAWVRTLLGNSRLKITHVSPFGSPYTYVPVRDKVYLFGVGGGGGGGGGASSLHSGGGGGAGLGCFLTECVVTPGSSLVLTTGVGGNGGTVGNDGADGTASTCTNVNGATLTLLGGKGGKGATVGAGYCEGGAAVTGGDGFGGIFAGERGAYGIGEVPGSGGGSVLASASNPIIGTPVEIDRGAGGAGGYINFAGQKGGDGYWIVVEP